MITQALGGLSGLLLPSSPEPWRRRHNRCHLPQPQGGELKTRDSIQSALENHLGGLELLPFANRTNQHRYLHPHELWPENFQTGPLIIVGPIVLVAALALLCCSGEIFARFPKDLVKWRQWWGCSMFMVTFRHGEDVDKNVSNSDVNPNGFIILLSDSEFDKKRLRIRFGLCRFFICLFEPSWHNTK